MRKKTEANMKKKETALPENKNNSPINCFYDVYKLLPICNGPVYFIVITGT